MASAGLSLPATLAERLGAAALADELVDLAEAAGAANVGDKVMTFDTRSWPEMTASTTSTSCAQ